MLDELSLQRLLSGYMDPRLITNVEFLVLLLLMMLVMNALEISGMLSSLGRRIVNRACNERRLALMLCILVFMTSALLTNDVVLLGIVPLTIVVGVVSRVDVKKLGVFEGIAANAGSLLTPFGNPQNIFISVHYDISFADFLLAMLPLWLLSLGLLVVLVSMQFRDRRLHPIGMKQMHRRIAALAALALFLIILFFGRLLPLAVIAPAVLGMLLATGRIRHILGMLDWKLFLLFALMAFSTYAALMMYTFRLSGTTLLLSSIGLSQVVSNVPAAFILSGTMDWRTLALGVNIGGSGTLISSIATVIAYRYIKKYDARTTLWDFMRWGALFCVLQAAVMLPVIYMWPR
jgi:Na+/H+ antiporter NhaD/arsenite permease-like protein